MTKINRHIKHVNRDNSNGFTENLSTARPKYHERTEESLRQYLDKCSDFALKLYNQDPEEF